MPSKQDALQRIESHEKLCRIMQKQTYERMNQLQTQITRIERILLVSMGSVMTGMGGVIVCITTSSSIGTTQVNGGSAGSKGAAG